MYFIGTVQISRENLMNSKGISTVIVFMPAFVGLPPISELKYRKPRSQTSKITNGTPNAMDFSGMAPC
jgi:hypothetical protein